MLRRKSQGLSNTLELEQINVTWMHVFLRHMAGAVTFICLIVQGFLVFIQLEVLSSIQLLLLRKSEYFVFYMNLGIFYLPIEIEFDNTS